MPSRAPLAAVTGGLLLGGSTTFLVNLAHGLQEFGENLPVVCLSDSNEHESDFEKAGARLFVMRDRRLIYEDRLAWAYTQVASLRPRAILACLGSDSFEILRLVPPNIRRIGLIQADHKDSYATAAAFEPWVDMMVGVSDQISRRIKAMPEFSAKPVHSIPYGIDFPETCKRSVRPPETPLRVIYVGRMIEEQKRVSRFIELANQLEAERAFVRLTLVGGGPQEANLRTKLAGNPIATVVGEVTNDQVGTLLRQHDVFILLSDYEGLPLALLEAMGSGLVPVVSDLPSGIREAVPNGAGIRVPVGDVGAAASALKTLAADPVSVMQMSSTAQKHVRERYSATRMARDYLQLAGASSGNDEPWPGQVTVPPPIGLNPLIFSGFPRKVRRYLRRFGVLRPRSSTQS